MGFRGTQRIPTGFPWFLLGLLRGINSLQHSEGSFWDIVFAKNLIESLYNPWKLRGTF